MVVLVGSEVWSFSIFEFTDNFMVRMFVRMDMTAQSYLCALADEVEPWRFGSTEHPVFGAVMRDLKDLDFRFGRILNDLVPFFGLAIAC